MRGRQTGAKALIAVAAEEDGAGIGRVRMRTIPNASGDSLMAFVGESVEPGSVLDILMKGVSTRNYAGVIGAMAGSPEAAEKSRRSAHAAPGWW